MASKHDQGYALRYMGFVKTSPDIFTEVEEHNWMGAIEHGKVRGNVAEQVELLVNACPLAPENLPGNTV